MKQEVELQLIKRAQAGDMSAKEALFVQFKPLLWKFAKKTFCKWLDHDDLFQVASIAFLDCVSKFDASRGCRMITLLYAAIPNRLMLISKTSGLVRSPATHRGENKTKADLAQDMEGIGQFSEPSAEDFAAADYSEVVTRLHDEIKRLPERHRFVVMRRLEGWKLHEIGKELGVTRERTRQIEADAHQLLALSRTLAAAA